jgi:hypothetical protein
VSVKNTQNLSAIAPLEQAVADLFKRMQRSTPDISVLKKDCERLVEGLAQFREENLVSNFLGFPEKELAALKAVAETVSKKLTVAGYLLSLDSEVDRIEMASFYTKDYRNVIEPKPFEDIQVEAKSTIKPAFGLKEEHPSQEEADDEVKYPKNHSFFSKLSVS